MIILVHCFTGRVSKLPTCFSFLRSVLSLFSPNNCLLSGVRPCFRLRAYFYATKICVRCRPNLYTFCSLFYIFSIFADIEFKVSLLISLLYMPKQSLALFLLESSFDSCSSPPPRLMIKKVTMWMWSFASGASPKGNWLNLFLRRALGMIVWWVFK